MQFFIIENIFKEFSLIDIIVEFFEVIFKFQEEIIRSYGNNSNSFEKFGDIWIFGR